MGSESRQSFKYADFSSAQGAIVASSEKSRKMVSVDKGQRTNQILDQGQDVDT